MSELAELLAELLSDKIIAQIIANVPVLIGFYWMVKHCCKHHKE